ncbi:MAG: hypothetical protein K2Q26_12580 [Bdellovibrionales bacterium]|nr:hypothetical protein [Bdellovibrionales bacterium]
MRSHAAKALLSLCVSFLIVGCSSFPASTNELWKRAGYEDQNPVQLKPVMNRSAGATETIYVGRRILPSGDYFQEGVVQVVLKKSPISDPNLKTLK